MKRSLGYVVVLLVALSLTACMPAAPKPKVPNDESRQTLRVVAYEVPGFIDALIAGFAAKNANTNIEKVTIRAGDNEALSRIKFNVLADVVPISSGARWTGLVNLTPLILQTKLNPASYKQFYEAGGEKGAVFGLPVTVYPLMVVYNKELAERAAVKIPASGWSWDEFRAIALKLIQQTPNGPQPGIDFGWNEFMVKLWLEQKTGRPAWEADERSLTEALSFFSTLVHTDKSIAASPRRSKEKISAILGQRFVTGTVALSALYLSGPGVLPADFAWELAPIPSVNPAAPLADAGATWLSIVQDSPNQNLAWEFLQYASGPEGAQVLVKAGWTPAYITDDWGKWLSTERPTAPQALQTLSRTKWSTHPSDDDAVAGLRYLEFLLATNRVLSGSAPIEIAVADWKTNIEKLAKGN